MEDKIKIGEINEEKRIVKENESAVHLGSGDLEVYSTPSMVAFMEHSCKNLINKYIDNEALSSVGVSLDIKHLKAIKIGSMIKSRAKVTEIDRRKISFEVSVCTEDGIKIGSGYHTRFIVDKENFLSSVKWGINMKTDIEIAQESEIKEIEIIAEKLQIDKEYIELYGKYKAKISLDIFKKAENKKQGNLILVTSINPTKAGEGKSTVTIGLADALTRIGKKTSIALREPSLGPVFGMKGGAAGGGYAQVIPMEDINLHFTGDMHAISTANNLLSAAIDNHIHQGNNLEIDTRQIFFKRVMDMNDRALRNIVVGLGNKSNGFVREDNFMITVASEIMAIMCLSNSLEDLEEKMGNILIANDIHNNPVFAKDLEIEGAMALIMKDAIKPNLVQSLEGTPSFIHGGPFANIAHGANSILATKMSLLVSDYTVTEAGFGADLGAEKFFNITSRLGNLNPDAVIIVATIKALKLHGGLNEKLLTEEDLESLERGMTNLDKQIENIKKFNIEPIVAINKFSNDTELEIEFLENYLKSRKIKYSLTDVWAKGGAGAIDLANKAVDAIESKKEDFQFLYDIEESIEDKINKIVREIYGGAGFTFSPEAKREVKSIKKLGLSSKPICMAKTQYSLSDNPKLLARPEDFIVEINNVRLSNGAGFIVCEAGSIMTMPGLPKIPAANNMKVDKGGNIKGLF